MKNFSLNHAKWLIAPLITVAIIGLMWCYYILVHVPDRVEYLSGRNLRVLSVIGNEITSATENYNQVLRVKWQAGDSTLGEGKKHEKVSENYEIKHTFEHKGSIVNLNLTYIPVKSGNSLHPESHQSPVGLTPREFDLVLVVNQSGQVLFHQAPAGIRINSLEYLVRAADQESENDEGRDVIVAGQPYTLFLLPVEVPVNLVREASNNIKEKERWTLAGLVRKSRFTSESNSISYTLQSVVLSLMIVMLVSLPLMRMLTLSQRERVQR